MKTYNHEWLIAEWKRMGRPEVERYPNSRKEWKIDEDPDFNPIFQYRIKSKPWIDWDHVSDDVGAMATFPDGMTFLFMEAPNMTGRYGISGGGIICNANLLESFTTGACAWQDSLVLRP